VNSLSGTAFLRPLTLLLSVGAALAVAAPTHAQSTTVRDPRNQPARADIGAATYSDRETSAHAVVHVRRLRPTGTLTVRITRADGRVGYDAIVESTHGRLSSRLARVAGNDESRVACHVRASWSSTDGTVRVSVPQSCLRFKHFQSRHRFTATFASGSHRDTAAAQLVGRGGSPGCATAAEMRRVTDGERLTAVHTHLDTGGRFGDGGAGGFSRVYRACLGGKPYWVEYDGRSRRVTGKGRA
jgi:hypothetical protein